MTHHISVIGLVDPGKRWEERAACAAEHAAIYFPEVELVTAVETDARNQLCQSCPVFASCLDDGLDFGDAYGVRAGYDPDHRARLDMAWTALFRRK